MADKNDEFNRRIDVIVKALEDSAVMMKEAISKMQGKMKYEIRRHCAEYIEVSFESSNQFQFGISNNNSAVEQTANSAPSSFTIRSEPLRKIPQSAAFSTIVDPPPNQIQSHTKEEGVEKDASPKANRKRKALHLQDSDDDLDQKNSLTSAQREEKELDLNFGIEVSIDEIKRAYGVIENSDTQANANNESNVSLTTTNQRPVKESSSLSGTCPVEGQQDFIGKVHTFTFFTCSLRPLISSSFLSNSIYPSSIIK